MMTNRDELLARLDEFDKEYGDDNAIDAAAAIRDLQAQLEAERAKHADYLQVMADNNALNEQLVAERNSVREALHTCADVIGKQVWLNTIAVELQAERKAREEAERWYSNKEEWINRAEAAELRCAQIEAAVRNVLYKDVTLLTSDDFEKLERALQRTAAPSEGQPSWKTDSQESPAGEHLDAAAPLEPCVFGVNTFAAAPPIWEQLAVLGESAPEGTWDHVPAEIARIRDRIIHIGHEYAAAVGFEEAVRKEFP